MTDPPPPDSHIPQWIDDLPAAPRRFRPTWDGALLFGALFFGAVAVVLLALIVRPV